MAVSDEELLEVSTTLVLAEVRRIETTLDPLNPNGSLYQLNQTHSTDNLELYQLLEQAQTVVELTDGGLNIFMGYLEQAYGFFRLTPRPPKDSLIREIMLSIERARIELSTERAYVEIPNDAYQISLTGIQEGYAADQALAMLALAGISDATVQLGAVRACAESADGLGWEHTVIHPVTGAELATLYLENCGLATASIRDQEYTYRNVAYHNHLDPHTGYPADSLLSVTVVAPSTELAAALARGIFPHGAAKGLQILNELPGVEGLILDSEGQIHRSDSLDIWMKG